MQIRRFVALASMLVLVVFVLNVAVAAADEQSGTWKMNPAKSKYSPGPAPKSITVKIESDKEKFEVDSEGVDASGNPTHVEFTAKLDGKGYPIKGAPNGDTVFVKRINSNTIETVVKKGDEVVMKVRSVVSKDGKTRRATYKGKDAQGKAVNNVVVFEKQ